MRYWLGDEWLSNSTDSAPSIIESPHFSTEVVHVVNLRRRFLSAEPLPTSHLTTNRNRHICDIDFSSFFPKPSVVGEKVLELASLLANRLSDFSCCYSRVTRLKISQVAACKTSFLTLIAKRMGKNFDFFFWLIYDVFNIVIEI